MSKHWTRTALRYLPKSIRHRVMRRSLQLRFDWPESLEVKLATSREEFEQAFRLAHDRLAGQDGVESHPSGLLVLPQHILPQSHVIVAKWQGRVIGTLSLISDNPLGLPMDKAASLRSHRTGTRRLAEVTSVAIHEDFERDPNQALLPLLKYVYHLSRRSLGLDRLVSRLKPEQIEICRAVLGFDPLESRNPVRPDIKHNGDLSLFLDIDNFERRLTFAYAYKPRSRNLMTWLHTLPESRFMSFPDRKYHHVSEVVISPAVMSDLFFAEAGLHDRLSSEEIKIVSRFYRHPNYHRVFCQWTDFQPIRTPSEWRIDTHLTGDLGLSSQRLEVWNASRHGLFITTQIRLEKGQLVAVRVHVNERVQAKFQAEVQWVRRTHEYGLHLVKESPIWNEMVTDLERRFMKVASDTKTHKNRKNTSRGSKSGAESAA